MKVKMDSQTWVETEEMDEQELVRLRLKIVKTINSIRYDLDLAKAKKMESREYSPATWFASANYALNKKRQELQHLQKIIAERKRAKKEKDKTRHLSDYFMDVCREELPEGNFNHLFYRAIKMRDEEEG